MSTQSGNQRRHELIPVGASRKRKDWDVFDAHRVPVKTKSEPAPPPAAPRQQAQKPPLQPAGGDNRLLAGYLAHEFLTRGTLFGQPWDPSAATAKPLAPSRPQPLLLAKPQQKLKQPAPPEANEAKPPTAYAEVAYLLKTDGAHIPGVVNPTQLARLLRM